MIPEVRDDVLQLESLWDRKWAEQLKEAHRDSFLEDPVSLTFLLEVPI